MELVLVRHSISVSNHQERISGNGDDVPLSEAGIAYAKQCAGAFDWQRFDVVYTSTMTRAKQTAALLTGKQTPLHEDPRLVEMGFGDWEGLDPEPFRHQFPDSFDYHGMFNANFSKHAPHAESYAELTVRAMDFLAMLQRTAPSASVLAVSHGMTIRALVAAALHLSPEALAAPQNVAVNALHFDEHDGFRARLLTYDRVLIPQ
ncbi:MAG: histidine phosphatase family protein [Lactobacillus sp.]|jgi:probable phosphoglycerate mutase|uniref:Histidine phosphatase family protein n=1 Tax=Lacticaseibacillus suilingensis TaxID=2799577 RepID=A0ABW4BD52_9LACO|nr:histidine phosphatase family protein [Lacticaseibacillus suilingensis]MCI1893631.1 histidine phosphatase family protein [Lactobacillus sp.]MCI1941263.1 histidine phosphatase family protein [Lactobacillus sp.]MCI1971807.1 histidine phosphatase family protein [Lactobacillus sp.]MCI2017063.1 histidine phosphatase family protein [Lactobacillus sp.]MCI2036513.1 histidine phosphatase family protein [Lactobacillus sp.]